MRVPPVTSPMTVKVRKLYKRDRVVSDFIEGSRVLYRTEEPASRTNPTGAPDDIELEREASLHRELPSGVASPSEGGPSKAWGVTSSVHPNKPSATGSRSRKTNDPRRSVSPTPLGITGGNEQSDTFWDGDPSTQSFIQFVGLSSPSSHYASGTRFTRSRPASAPSRRGWAKTSASTAFASPRQIRTANAGDYVGGTHQLNNVPCFSKSDDDDGVGRKGYLSGRQGTYSTDRHRGEGAEEGMMGALERRLGELARENTRLRDARLETKKEVYSTRLDRMARLQRRNLEVLAALQSAKEGAEKRARRIQDRLRAVQNKLRRKVAQECATTTATDDAQRERDLSAGGPIGTNGTIKNDLTDASGRVKLAAQNDRAGGGTAQSLTTAAETIETADVKSGGKIGTNTPAARSWVEPAGASGEADNQHRQARPAAHETVRLRQYLENSSEGLIAVPPLGANEAVRGATAFSRGGGGLKSGGVGAAGAVVRASTQEQRRWSLVERSLYTARERHRKNEEEKKKRKGEEEEENEWSIRRKRERLNKSPRRDDSGRGGGGGGGGGCHDNDDGGGRNGGGSATPKVLLQREIAAARRREERTARAREKEQDELKLASSFRATELHAASGPDWATIKAHQDSVRKQRVRERAAHLVATSSLPPRMARHAAMQAVEEDRERSSSKAGKGGATAWPSPPRRCKTEDAPSLAWTVPGDARGEGEGVESAGAGTRDQGGDRAVHEEEREEFGHAMRRRQQRWASSLAAAKASSRVTVTRPRTPPMEKRRLAEEAKRRARDEAQCAVRDASAARRKEHQRRRFERLVEAHRQSGRNFRETNASRKKAEETRKKIEWDLQEKENERLAIEADVARQREVSRAVKAYVDTSEARRREEHGAGPGLDELIRRKKEEKHAEFRQRRRLNKAGLRQALRKRPNLLERQEKHAQLHSKRAAAQATSARAFLESRDGFAAAGRRATRGGGEGGWQAKASADSSFTAQEKQKLGLDLHGSSGNSTGAAQSTWPNGDSGEDDATREEGEGGGDGAALGAVDGVDASSVSPAAHTASGAINNIGDIHEREVDVPESCDRPQEGYSSFLGEIRLREDGRSPESEGNGGGDDDGARASPSNKEGGRQEEPPSTVLTLEPAAGKSSDVGSGTQQGENVAE